MLGYEVPPWLFSTCEDAHMCSSEVPENLRSLKIPVSVESQLVGVDNEDLLCAQHILHQRFSTALLLPDQHTLAIPQCTIYTLPEKETPAMYA